MSTTSDGNRISVGGKFLNFENFNEKYFEIIMKLPLVNRLVCNVYQLSAIGRHFPLLPPTNNEAGYLNVAAGNSCMW